MSWAPSAVGTYVRGTGTLTPSLPVGWSAGQIALLWTGNRGASINANATVGNGIDWTQLTIGVNCFNIALFGRQLQAGDAAPTVDWDQKATQTGFALIRTYDGGSLTIHAQSDRASTNTALLPYPSRTITQPNCLVVACGRHLKTSTSNGCTIGSLANFTTIATDIPNGSTNAAAYNEWIQTTATNTSLDTQSMSIADSSSNSQGFTIALLPATVITPSRSLLGVGT